MIRRHALGLLGFSYVAFVCAAPPPLTQCKDIDDAVARLACHDRESGRVSIDPQPATLLESDDLFEAGLSLSAAWELESGDKRGTFRLLPHRLNYLMPARYTTQVNERPGTPAPDHGINFDLPIQPAEAKFQFSIKVKAWEDIFGNNGDLWLAYTQQSNWQLYNHGISAPFRETDYEPEVMLTLRTKAEVLGWDWKLLNVGFVHQSNGQPLPFSRSWNRLYAQLGFEKGRWTMIARPWIRIPEKASGDDNPDIRDYLGDGDIRVAYQRNRQVYSLLGRYSVSGQRGFAQFEWAFPISGALRGYLQASQGYGESLIDYNHAQATLGVGFLLLPWQ